MGDIQGAASWITRFSALAGSSMDHSWPRWAPEIVLSVPFRWVHSLASSSFFMCLCWSALSWWLEQDPVQISGAFCSWSFLLQVSTLQNSCPGHPTSPPQFREAAKFHLIPTAHTRACKPFRQLVGAIAGLTSSVTFLSRVTDPCCPTPMFWLPPLHIFLSQFLSCFRLVPGTPSWLDWTKFLNLQKFRRFLKYPNF